MFLFTGRRAALMSSAMAVLLLASAAEAADAASKPEENALSELVVTAQVSTRSAVSLQTVEIQKILPGVSPLKAIQTLPGVLYVTADPGAISEQNLSLFVHGSSTQQLGYAMDGVPLGDQQYGNYNGLSPSRAVTSENVERVTCFSAPAPLGSRPPAIWAGPVETFSGAPSAERVRALRQTVGSYQATRTFVRFDTGQSDSGDSAYISYLHHDAKAWDFDWPPRRPIRANLKYVHASETGGLTADLRLEQEGRAQRRRHRLWQCPDRVLDRFPLHPPPSSDPNTGGLLEHPDQRHAPSRPGQ